MTTVHYKYQRLGWLPVLFGVLALAFGAAAGILVMGVPSTLRLAVIVMGIAAFLATIARIQWGLLVLIFITFTRLSDIAIQFHGAPSVAKSFVVLLLLAIIVRWAFYGERPRGWERMVWLAALYGVVGFASLLYAADPARAQEVTLDHIKDVVIALVVIILMQDGKTMRRAIWALLVAGIFLGTLTVIQFATDSYSDNYWGFAQSPVKNIVVGEEDSQRAAGPIGDPNFFAQIMLIVVPFALDRFWNEKNRYVKLLAGWALAASVLSIVFSFSRGGFVALTVMLLAMLMYRRQKFVNWLLAIAVAIVIIQFVPPSYLERIQTLTSVIPGVGGGRSEVIVRSDSAIQGRTNEMVVAWRMFNDNPLLGVGLGNYQVHYQSYAKRVGLGAHSQPRAAHNLYLEIASETGLLGLVTFGLLLYVMFRDLTRARRALAEAELHEYKDMVSALIFALVGYMTAAIFVHAAYPRYFWLLAGMAFAVPWVVRYELRRQMRAKERRDAETAMQARFVADGT